MENKMRMFKVMSALLLLLVIGNTFMQNNAMIDAMANPMKSPSEPSNETPVLELPMVCILKATESATVLPAIDLGTVGLGNQTAPAHLTIAPEEPGVSIVWLKATAQNRHELKSVFITYGIVLILMSLALFVFLVMVLVAACKILWNFTRERIFTLQQSKRLTRLAIYLVVLGVLNNAVGLFSHYYAAAHVSIEGWNFVMPSLSCGDFIVALLILLFNEMLKHSILLKEEQSLTI